MSEEKTGMKAGRDIISLTLLFIFSNNLFSVVTPTLPDSVIVSVRFRDRIYETHTHTQKEIRLRIFNAVVQLQTTSNRASTISFNLIPTYRKVKGQIFY